MTDQQPTGEENLSTEQQTPKPAEVAPRATLRQPIRYLVEMGILSVSTVVLVIAVFSFRYAGWAPYNVPTGSMLHTIEIGDHIVVNKHAFGWPIPFTGGIKIGVEKVQRGDIVVFPYPENPEIDFIKRVVAVGGDQVRFEGEDVYINGQKNTGEHIFLDATMYPMLLNTSFTVPEGKLWLMGDNRRNSKDSRYWGFLTESTVVGRASFVYWSYDSSKGFLAGMDFGRIGTELN